MMDRWLWFSIFDQLSLPDLQHLLCATRSFYLLVNTHTQSQNRFRFAAKLLDIKKLVSPESITIASAKWDDIVDPVTRDYDDSIPRPGSQIFYETDTASVHGISYQHQNGVRIIGFDGEKYFNDSAAEWILRSKLPKWQVINYKQQELLSRKIEQLAEKVSEQAIIFPLAKAFAFFCKTGCILLH